MENYMLEVCADSVESAIAAQEGGADRIELCSNLVLGGTSPGTALYRLVRQYTDLKVRVLLRPRYGDYCYNAYEFEQLKEEVACYRELGADGVVIGLLNPDGSLNTEQMAELVQIAGTMKKTLHRAFDVCRDPFETLEQAIELGMDTILTSGQKETAWEGRTCLKKLREQSAGRIEILAGSGISAESIRKLVPETGISAYHMSGKETAESAMQYRKEGVSLGLPERGDYQLWRTSASKVREAVRLLRELERADKG